MLTNSQVVQFKIDQIAYDKSAKVIVDRVDEILHLIHEIFGSKLLSWWFHEFGVVFEHGCPTADDLDEDEIYYLCVMQHPFKKPETSKHMYHLSFPTKFLYMSDEDITAQIQQEMAEDRQARNKKDNEKTLEERRLNEIRVKALNKLDAEEKKALNLRG